MPKRFQQKHNISPILDLHGFKHIEVELVVEDFLFKNQAMLPLKIITGNSDKMKLIVKNVLNKHDFTYSEGDYYNLGYIDVLN